MRHTFVKNDQKIAPEEDIEIVDTLQKETEEVAFAHGTLAHSRPALAARKGEERNAREWDFHGDNFLFLTKLELG